MVKKIKNKIFKSKNGYIFKFINNKSVSYKKFGEIYFNHLRKKNKSSDWILHRKCQCLISVINGKVQFFYKQNKKQKTFILDSKKNNLLIISPKTFFRFKSLSNNSIFVNLIDLAHDPKETLKIPLKVK